MPPLLELTLGPIRAPDVGERLRTPSIKPLAQRHGDLEKTSVTSKSDEMVGDGSLVPCLGGKFSTVFPSS